MCVLLALASPVGAQTTFATITGTVTDPSGAVVSGAAVTATNVETGVTTRAATNDEGVYTVPQLREGPYLLSIAATGFREHITTDILLVTRDIRRIDAKLEVGGLETAVHGHEREPRPHQRDRRAVGIYSAGRDAIDATRVQAGMVMP